jgi:hypothetical protein
MNQDTPENTNASPEQNTIREAHQELDEVNEARKTITDLVNYRKALLDPEHGDFEKFDEIRGKALSAINHLFEEGHPSQDH